MTVLFQLEVCLYLELARGTLVGILEETLGNFLKKYQVRCLKKKYFGNFPIDFLKLIEVAVRGASCLFCKIF